jgi:type II restriction enzyme
VISEIDAKNALDKIIQKARVHFYKPFQIAEILYHHRLANPPINLLNVETYRNVSKRWRDDISLQLVGRYSTSSAKYQDNVFDANA